MTLAGFVSRFVAAAVLLAGPAAAAYADEAQSPYVEGLLARARAQKIAEDRMWQVLVHYRPSGHGWKSEADGPDFFLSPDGKKNPEAELEATIAAFARPAAGDDHPQCHFPARYKWLKARLAFDPGMLPEQTCDAFDAWTAGVDPGSARLVFASSQIDAPASMYGHTFLRLDRNGAGAGTALLSTAVTYSAYPWTRNPVLYVVLGLAGGFQGKFQVLPYFVKVQEYTNLDSRDLFEYPLKLDADQIDWMERHLWELDRTWFDYFFFKENCSYHLLGLLDVVKPDAHLVDRFGAWTLPIDTVRVIDEAGLASPPERRPSHVATMRARRDALPVSDRALVPRLADAAHPIDWGEVDRLSDERQAAVLDASFDFLKYRYGFRPGVREAEYSEAVRAREKLLLHRRSEIPVLTSPPIVPPTKTQPLEGHLSARGGAGVRALGDGHAAVELWWRPAEHDVLDPPAGFPADAGVEMFSFRLRVDPSRVGAADNVILERADLVKITNFVPLEEWIHKSSWRVGFGGGRVRELGCATWNCTAADFEFAYGISFHADPGFRNVVYLMAETQEWAGPAFQPRFRAGAGPVAGMLMEPASRWRITAEAALRYDALGDRGPRGVWDFGAAAHAPRGAPAIRALSPVWRLEAATSVDLGAHTALRADAAKFGNVRELFVGFVRYF